MTSYRTIDPNNYPHRAHLEYFLTMEHPHVTVTSEVDVTALKRFVKQENCSFSLAFLHVLAISADSVPQFRQRIHRLSPEELLLEKHANAPKSGVLSGIEIREYLRCPTSHIEPTGEDLYGYCLLSHDLPWKEYIASATEAQRLSRIHGTLDDGDDIEACYFPSGVPWIHYTEVVHPTSDRFDSNPRFTWGKYEEDWRGKLMMPLTVAVHHGLADGIHLGRFYAAIEKNTAALAEGKDIGLRID